MNITDRENKISKYENEFEVETLKGITIYRKKAGQKYIQFSLIVPVYEEEKIIESHLELFSHELRKKYNFELIVSDGGSSDSSVRFAKQYADTVVCHTGKHRQTIAEGRNRGAENSKGEILIFLNVDSIPEDLNNFFDTILDFANKNGNYSKYGALASYVTGLPDQLLIKDKIFYFLINNYFHLLNIIKIGMGRGECQIVRRDIFQKAGAYNSSIAAGEDFDLYRRIAKFSKIKFERKIKIYESPRRFRKDGYLKIMFYWLINSLFVLCFGKSVSKEWKAVR